MKYRTLFFGGSIATLLTVLYTAVMYSRLPERIATHWNASGQADKFSPKFEGLVIVPVMQIFMMVVFGALPFLSPRRASIDSFARVYNLVCVYVLVFLGFTQVMMVQAALGSIDVNKWIVYGMLAMFALIGNVITKTRRNYWMGVRTPWTLENEDVWNLTHRFAGRVMVLGSVTGLVLTVFGVPAVPVILLVVGCCVLPVPYSFYLYKRMKLG